MRSAHSPRRAARGAVLAELIVTMLIGGLLLSVLPGFYFGYTALWREETGKLGAGQRSTIVFRRLRKDVRNARAAVVSADGATLTLISPQLAYDSGHSVMSPVLSSDGRLVDGDAVQYYFVRDPENIGSTGGTILRRLVDASGAGYATRLVADSVYPSLNPLSSETGSPVPIFRYDSGKRTVNITVTAAEPYPSGGSFAPVTTNPICSRDAGTLVRVSTPSQPQGAIQCSKCGARANPAVELVTVQASLVLRNG